MSRFLVVVVIAFGLISCQSEGRVYKKNQELSPDVEWLRKDFREFRVPIKDISIPYRITLTLRYANGFQYQYAKVKVTETTPGGKSSVKEYELKVRESNGDYIGDGSMDIWDSNHIVEAAKKYMEPGTYTYVIEHNMPDDPLPFVLEVGMILDKVK